MNVTLVQANDIIAAAFAHGAGAGMKPLTVAVLDSGGHLVALQRQEGASALRPQIAIGKAFAAISLGLSSRAVAEMAVERPYFVGAVAALAPAGLVPAAGGVLVFKKGGLVGAVGVTGDTSDNDEACALAGIAAIGLAAGA